MLASLMAGAQPSPGMAKNKSLQATVEDCLSDDDHGHAHAHGVAIEPFTPEPSPGKANVRTKRSNPEDMGNDKTPTTRVPNSFEVRSDSGYSSQSVAGMSSADSAASAASSQRSPPAAPANPSPTPDKRLRPTHSRQQSSNNAEMRYTLPGREPQPQRQRPPMERSGRSNPPPKPAPPAPKRRDSRNAECTTPGCTGCGPDTVEPRPRASRRQSMVQPTESAPNFSHPHVYDNRSQISDPADYPGSSSKENRPRLYQSQGGPVIQPATSRRPSVNSRHPRPTSYHGDFNPNYNWQQPGMHSPHPNTPPQHGPPPSRSAAWGNVHPYAQPQVHQMNNPYMPQYPPPPGPPPAAFYQAQQMQPSRDPQRPPLQTRPSAYGYPAQPVMQVERSDRPMISARYPSNNLPSLAAPRQPARIDYRKPEEEEDSESSSETDTESEEETEYPPQRPRGSSSNQRPTFRHPNTTSAPAVPQVNRPQTIVVPERHRVSDRTQAPKPSRRTSTSRPPLIPSTKSQSAYETPQARMLVEGSRSSRRESLQAYDRTFQEHRQARQREYHDPARTKRSSRIYGNGVDYERDFHDDDDDEADAGARPSRPRRDTNTRRRSHKPVELSQADVAEKYINSRRGGGDAVADVSYEVAKKRSSRTSGGPSEPGSSRSKGSDNNGEIRLRIGNDAPVTLSLNGDMEGRTLQLVPIDHGMNELVISSNGRSGESTYRSETRSVHHNRRAITSASQARRDAEEMTEQSSSSSQRRRQTRGDQEEPRRVLHRSNRRKDQRETDYRY